MLKITSFSKRNELDLVAYELQMLNAAFPLGYATVSRIDENFRLESFLVHVRNLMDFLEEKGDKNKGDIMISQFIDRNKKPMKPIKLNLDSNLKEKINKHCQHLTKTRLTEKINWPVSRIAREINSGMSKFISQLNGSYNKGGISLISKAISNYLISS